MADDMDMDVQSPVATALTAADPAAALTALALSPPSEPTPDRTREDAVYALARVLAKAAAEGTDEGRRAARERLVGLVGELEPLFSRQPRARCTKIVRNVINLVRDEGGDTGLLVELCRRCGRWAEESKRVYLKQRVETELAALHLDQGDYHGSLDLLRPLIRDVKRLDNKEHLVELHLIESRVQFALRDGPKARAALTAGKTAANAIYLRPDAQAAIDMHSGTLHAEERDYKTAYSYFYEAFEGWMSLDLQKRPEWHQQAVLSLKYMLLCKIMVGSAAEVDTLMMSKQALRLGQRDDLEAMKAVADAHRHRSLKEFQTALEQFQVQLKEDPTLHSHVSELYDTLLEQNLSRIIEAFSRVEVPHVAKLIDLPLHTVERKLSQMILDQKIAGVLDQGNGCLIIYDDPPAGKMYPTALDTMSALNGVVDSLFAKAQKLT